MKLFYRPGGSFLFGTVMLFIFSARCFAQNEAAPFIYVRNINIYGNDRTRESVILREIPFKAGDSVLSSSYSKIINSARENIFNTGLFNFVTIDSTGIAGNRSEADMNIRVIERWYIWPWPYFQFSDRNFNSWLETTDFSRLTWGIDLLVQNVRGRNETLKIPLHFGYNQEFGAIYQMPFVNRKKTIGLEFAALYGRNHEVITGSIDNKPVYYKDPASFSSSGLHVGGTLFLRRGLYVKHTFSLDFNSHNFSDSIFKVIGYSKVQNPKFISFYYQYRNDHRDVHFYPLKGSYFDVEVYKYGFWQAIDELHVKMNLRKFWRLHNRWYFASGLTLYANLSGEENYFLQKGLGYGRDFIRGYEYYVIDGKAFGLLKNNLKFAIIPQKVLTIDFIRTKKFNTIPYALYMNVFTDLGYVHNKSMQDNRLNDMQDALQVGYGAGLDFTTYYDIVIRLEASLNGRGEPGVYLHFMAPI